MTHLHPPRRCTSPRRRLACAALLLGLLAACGDDAPPGSPPPDEADAAAQEDAPADVSPAPPDAADADASSTPDAAPDVAPDAPPEPPIDWEAPLAAQGPWGPAARVTRLRFPDDAAEGRQLGCQLFGANLGAGLGNLALLAGGLDVYLRPDGSGQIPLLLILQALGWEAEARPADVEALSLRFFDGLGGPDPGYTLARASFEEDDPTRPPRTAYPPAPLEEGWVETAPRRFLLRLPLFGALVLRLPVEAARVTAHLRADGPGVGGSALVAGYVSRDAVIDLILSVQEACLSPARPAICAAFGNAIQQPAEELIPLIEGFHYGYDARLVDGHPYPCDPRPEADPEEACNAVSACVLLDLAGIAVDGVASE